MRLRYADTHPDRETICVFRRGNDEWGPHGGVAVALDGTKGLANASRHPIVGYGRTGEQLQQVDVEIAQLVGRCVPAARTVV